MPIKEVNMNQTFKVGGEEGMWRISIYLENKVLVERIGDGADMFLEYESEVELW